MKFISKSIMLVLVLVMVSACSTAFETAGLGGDDASLLSAALSFNPAVETMDVDYTFNLAISAEGENMAVASSGKFISDPATGSSLISLAGSLDGFPDLGGESFPFDIELRTINESDLYILGLSSMVDPSAPADQWLFLDAGLTSQMAMASSPELQSSGIMSGGDVDFAGLYDSFDSTFFASFSNYLSATRADDMDGLAHYVVTLDLGEWIGSDELNEGLQTLIPMLAGDSVPAEELEAGMAQLAMLPMVGVLLSDGTYQFDYYVDPASASLARSVVTIDLTIDPATMGQTGDPVSFALTLDTSFNEFGADSAIVAPENFVDLMGG